MPRADNNGIDREFSNNAPQFRRRFARGEYRQEGGDADQFSRWELGTYSADIGAVAERGHALLQQPADGRPQGAVTNYSRDSGYAHSATRFVAPRSATTRSATTRMQNAIPYFRQQDIGSNHVPSVFTDPLKRVTRSALAKYNEECRSEHGMYWSDVPTAQQTVLEIERALSAMPRSGDRNIDAQEFNPETPYQGNMVFRGAIAANRQTDRPIYVPDGAPGGIAGGLRTGDYVTNTDLMSTSAVAAVAGEFVMRQRLKVPESNPAKYVAGKNHAEYDERRILFTIDHQSGRPIAQYSQEQQAEVLFCRGAVFKIEKIDKSDYGVIVRLAERPGGCWAPDTGQFTGIAEAPGAKIHNMMIGGEVPKIDVYSPPAPTRE